MAETGATMTSNTVRRDVFCGWLPQCKGLFEVFDDWVWCSLLSGLLMQSFMLTAGLDGIRESGPTLLCGQ